MTCTLTINGKKFCIIGPYAGNTYRKLKTIKSRSVKKQFTLSAIVIGKIVVII